MQRRHGNRYVARLVQGHGQADPTAAQSDAVHDLAASGMEGTARWLPHADRLQQALGEQTLRSVRVYTDAPARAASRALGAEAYTVGNRIAFAVQNPSVRTVAHEVAHVLQQRAGAHRDGGPGDRLERTADSAADAIVGGRSPAAFLPGTASSPGPVPAAAVQAKIGVKPPVSPLLRTLAFRLEPTTRALRSFDEVKGFTQEHGVSVEDLARRRSPIRGVVWSIMLPLTAKRMIDDDEPRVYEQSPTGAALLADAIVDETFGLRAFSGPTLSPPSSLPSTGYGYTGGGGTGGQTTFDYGLSLLTVTPVPKSVADFGSRKLRSKLEPHKTEHPVQEGIEGAFTSRTETLTRVPQNPAKTGELLPWVDYYFFGGGDKDMQRTVDIAASKMSKEEGQKFKQDFEKLKFDQQMKITASAGTGVAVGQAIGLIPHPAAKVAKVAWQATGAVALNNKLGDVSDQLQKFEAEHPKGFKIMREQRDESLKKVHAERRERRKRITQELLENP